MTHERAAPTAVYAAAIALGAFLLFLLQPIAAKAILPWFGGSAAVWSACLLFFQGVLLVGYLYAAWLDRRVPPRVQVRVHLVVIALSVLVLPLALRIDWRPNSPDWPALGILVLLTGTVGLPYFVLSTTAPLVQAWYRGEGGARPYRFYALSNAASLAALAAYPFAIEPVLSMRTQAIAWLGAYVAFIVLTTMLALRRGAAVGESHNESEDVAPPRWTTRVWWIALAACPSLLLVSITSHLTQDIAPIPLLWVLPLGAYLVSFIVCFSSDRAYRREVWILLALIEVAVLTYMLYGGGGPHRLTVAVGIFTGGLLACSMFCHGELARRKPAARHLTTFYVMVALGGVAGSAFATLVAPVIFAGNYELPVGLVFCALLIEIVVIREIRRRPWSLVLPVLAGAVLTFAVADSWRGIRTVAEMARLQVRNFYGTLRVIDGTTALGYPFRDLRHGLITHGLQEMRPDRACEPIAYYGRPSGLYDVLASPNRPMNDRVGVIGLGAGAVATYARPGDTFTFYEINPLVVDIARSEFTYLSACAPPLEILPGDARLTLERDATRTFDVLVVDAFSGDAVPVHLLTREAFDLYFRRLESDGVLAVHISNRYVDLQPVLEAAAQALGKDLRITSAPAASDVRYTSTWGLLAAPGRLADIEFESPRASPKGPSRLWTDDFSSVWALRR